MRSRATLLLVLAASMVRLTSCANEPVALPYDSPAPATVPEVEILTVAPPTTVGPVSLPEARPSAESEVATVWRNVTSNLADLASECDGFSLLSPWPGTGRLLAGISMQGLWITADGGSEWARLGDGEASTITNLPMAIVFDPEDSDRFWEIGRNNSGAVYRTDDGGTTFEQLGEAPYGGHLSVDFSDPARQTLILGAYAASDVYRSGDGGQTWVSISDDLPPEIGQVAATAIIDTGTFLVGSLQGPSAGVFRTTDGGTTWTRVFQGAVDGPPVVMGNGTMAWLLAYGAGLIVSDDLGESWSRNDGGGISYVADTLVWLPDGRLATVGEDGVIVSSDEGDSWRPVGPPFPFEPDGLTYDAVSAAFYAWHSTCSRSADNSVPLDAVAALSYGSPLGADDDVVVSTDSVGTRATEDTGA